MATKEKIAQTESSRRKSHPAKSTTPKKTTSIISKDTKTKQLPQHKIINKRVAKKMNPNRIREGSFILSNDMKSILYIRTHFNDPLSTRKIFHTIDIFKKKVSNVDEVDMMVDNNLISFIYENTGEIEKNDKDKKRVIAEAKKVADSFFSGYKIIEVEDAIVLIEEKIARNMLQPQNKSVRERRKELKRGLKFINEIVVTKKKEKQEDS